MKPKLWLLTIFSSLLITPLPALLPNSLSTAHAQIVRPESRSDNRPENRPDAGVDVYAEAIRAFVTIGAPRGSGSGSIISSNGLVLTNAHVVRGTKEVTVQANNGNTYAGRVVSVDEGNDLALVQLNTRDSLPAVRIGNASNIRLEVELAF
jgi:S1-C subfamily serine protease